MLLLQPLLIADCRPRANAMANKAGGWGYENYVGCQLEFLGMHNIHAIRDAYRRVVAAGSGAEGACCRATTPAVPLPLPACVRPPSPPHRKLVAASLNPAPSDVNWAATIADCGWAYHVRTMVTGAVFVAEAMHRRGQSVLVHCSDGWDRTAQICSLVQVLLDPFFRTTRGLCVLVAKEWCAFGFKWHERSGHGNEKADDSDISPVFLQFLDGLSQLVRLFPAAFEYSSRLLLLIAYHSFSCRFGTFLFDCERERVHAGLAFRTPSLWGYVLARREMWANPAYAGAAGPDILLPHPSAVLRQVCLWDEW